MYTLVGDAGGEEYTVSTHNTVMQAVRALDEVFLEGLVYYRIDYTEDNMSYDVTVGTQEFNYTANLGKFFMDFGVHPRDMHGEPPYEVAHRISLALNNIPRFEFEALRRDYDAPNGWGDVEGAIRFLMDIYMACLTAEDGDTVEAT